MKPRISCTLALVLALTACSGPAYYLQAASGQWKLNRSRQDIQTLLDDPSTSPQLITQLETAVQIREFAQTALDLPANESYSSYAQVDGDVLVWNVVATPEFSLTPKKWCFLVAGCVPYRGFFKQEKAMESAQRLRKKGMDVLVSPAGAYSSLGWFEDPLLSTMISGSDMRLAAILFHELAHQRLYIKGDGAFNESYASFVAITGVKSWLHSHSRHEDLLNWQQLQDAKTDFSKLIGDTRNKLANTYLSDLPDTKKREIKADIINSLSNSYKQVSTDKWQGKGYYDGWFETPVNNAKLALYGTYESGHCAFQELLDTAAGNMQAFHRLAEQKASLQKIDRAHWLQQNCSTIAPRDNL